MVPGDLVLRSSAHFSLVYYTKDAIDAAMESKMQEKIPQKIQNIAMTFRNAGYQIYLVGGCVRDLLLTRETTDWDLTTNATPEKMTELYPDAFYDNVFGTVGIPLQDSITGEKTVVEVTTFRTEAGYSNRRHPDTVSWGKTIEEDLERRDFTINALAIDLSTDTQDSTLIDPYNGQEDLKHKLIRAVGNPAERFKEDALRLMRAVRIATQLEFSIEEKTLQAITDDAALLTDIATERIRGELLKILASDYPYEGIMTLKNTNLLRYILPELLEGVGVSQERPGRHHKDDVFTHNVLSLKFTPSTDPIVRFATLIHDIGKPRVATADADGYVIFHNHEIVGARMAGEIADRLHFSKKEKQRIMMLVRWHMFTVDEHITDSAVRRFIRRVGVENVKDMMDLRIGDRLGGGTQRAESWRLKLFKKRVEEQLAPAPFSINDLAIDGNDIMKELQIKPGKQIGIILQKLFEEVDEELDKNNREYLLKRIKEIHEK
jgi:tRNA nucleotidyltransferase (CCA-adding enzyme)